MTVQIRAGVGDGQTNHPEDVALVQLLLNGTAFGQVAVTSEFDAPTGAAVEAFQRHHFGFADRVLSPGDIGFLRLRGAPIDDALVDAHTDMMMRSMVVHFAQSGGAGAFGSVAFDSIRQTADGLGHVGEWLVGASAVSISSHPRFGTWEIQGAILNKYREINEESGVLGNPISGERQVPPGAVSWFEHGSLIYAAEDQTVTVSTTGG